MSACKCPPNECESAGSPGCYFGTAPDRTAPDSLVERLAGAVCEMWAAGMDDPEDAEIARTAPESREVARGEARALAPTVAAYAAEVAEAAVAARLAGVERLRDEWAEDIRRGHAVNPDGHPALTIHERDLDELRAALHLGGDEGSDGPQEAAGGDLRAKRVAVALGGRDDGAGPWERNSYAVPITYTSGDDGWRAECYFVAPGIVGHGATQEAACDDLLRRANEFAEATRPTAFVDLPDGARSGAGEAGA